MLLGQNHKSTAVITASGLFRYTLTRSWGDEPICCFVMLNPSTADHHKDDPTIRRCVAFAKLWGCGGLIVVNLFALRATNPNELYDAYDPIGEANDECIRSALRASAIRVAAWGVHGAYRHRDQEVVALMRSVGRGVQCLGLTKFGQPRHPLYVRADTKLESFVEDML